MIAEDGELVELPDEGWATIPDDSDDYQELRVRLASQSLLIRHLAVPMIPSREKGIAFSQPSEPPGSYWSDVKVDLTGAELIDVDFTLCVLGQVNFTNARFRGETRFWRTRFEEITDFSGAKFYGVAGFGRAVFETEGSFENVEVFDEARFKLAILTSMAALMKRGVVADVFIVGGAAMALAYDATRVTRDVDSLFVPHGVVLEEARNVAEDLGLPAWWLNEQASVYISGKDDRTNAVCSTILASG
jgi:hypothetical protein